MALSLVGAATLTLFAFTGTQLHTSYAAEDSVYSPITREYVIIAQDTTIEISPGVRVEAWTFNGTVPGSTMRATEGDRVLTHFINEGSHPHTIHLHGDHNEVNDGVFQKVLLGQLYTYDFIAEPTGAQNRAGNHANATKCKPACKRTGPGLQGNNSSCGGLGEKQHYFTNWGKIQYCVFCLWVFRGKRGLVFGNSVKTGKK